MLWVVWVLSVLWEKGVVWGFARLEGVLPEIPILRKVRKIPEIRPGGARGVWRRRHWQAVRAGKPPSPHFVRHLPRTRGRL